MPSPFVMVPDDRVLQLLQCVAVCCSVLQCVAECCNVCCSMFQKRTSSERDHTEAIRCGTLSNVLQRVAVFCMALQACCRELMCCSVLQCVAVCCSVCYREPVVCCGVWHVSCRCVAVSCSVLQCVFQHALQCMLQCMLQFCCRKKPVLSVLIPQHFTVAGKTNLW